ncbi:PorP/SprF family type IX secretion system membrane protein [Parasediminibacterium sp. JCM 36343]|uniref:PorP/SprF family type IX secretion system membrane protein n=1 Tax=Parasediminibacterium sp. JCM 36343 TaxID=3374279 RepID=UPI00397AC67E
MKKIAFCFLMMVCLVPLQRAYSQVDPHFSEYYVYPSWLNPALTGAIDGDYRVSAIYRNQWSGIANGFSTIGLAGEAVTNKNINIGGSILQQTAGDGGYTYLTGNVSLAYTGIKFGSQGYQRIAVGMQGGIVQRKINPSKLQFGDQVNLTNGSFDGGTMEAFPKTSATVFDAGAGAVYFDADPAKKANIYLGFSAFHITQPKDPLLSSSTGEKLPLRYTVHGGVKLTLSEVLSLTPNLLYLKQGSAEEKMVGAYAQLKATEATELLLGVNYRVKDAISPFLGLYYNSLVFGFSYDINNSDLGKAVSGTNSFEFSLSYTGHKSKKYSSEHFVCPRL